mmetsp:Transcript_8539/g.17317  ORF Transcript_8539/g.17317 Transcript_8539/m.17317 type:complete len:1525 (-) Transcript_8539:4-4578(-)
MPSSSADGDDFIVKFDPARTKLGFRLKDVKDPVTGVNVIVVAGIGKESPALAQDSFKAFMGERLGAFLAKCDEGEKPPPGLIISMVEGKVPSDTHDVRRFIVRKHKEEAGSPVKLTLRPSPVAKTSPSTITSYPTPSAALAAAPVASPTPTPSSAPEPAPASVPSSIPKVVVSSTTPTTTPKKNPGTLSAATTKNVTSPSAQSSSSKKNTTTSTTSAPTTAMTNAATTATTTAATTTTMATTTTTTPTPTPTTTMAVPTIIVPEPWSRHKCKQSGQVYYHNKDLKQSIWTVPNEVMRVNGISLDVTLPEWVTNPDTKTIRLPRQSHKKMKNAKNAVPTVGYQVTGSKYTAEQIIHLSSCIQKYDMDLSKESFVKMLEKEKAYWEPLGRSWHALREKAKKMAHRGEPGFTVLLQKEIAPAISGSPNGSTSSSTKYTVREVDHLRNCIQKYGMDYSRESFVMMLEKEKDFWGPLGRNWSALKEKAKKLANQGEVGFTVLLQKEQKISPTAASGGGSSNKVKKSKKIKAKAKKQVGFEIGSYVEVYFDADDDKGAEGSTSRKSIIRVPPGGGSVSEPRKMNLRKERVKTSMYSDMLYLVEDDVNSNFGAGMDSESAMEQYPVEDDAERKRWYFAKIVAVNGSTTIPADEGQQVTDPKDMTHDLFSSKSDEAVSVTEDAQSEVAKSSESWEKTGAPATGAFHDSASAATKSDSKSDPGPMEVDATASTGASTGTTKETETTQPAASSASPSTKAQTLIAEPVTYDVQYQSSEIEKNLKIGNLRWPKYRYKERVDARWNEGSKFYRCVILHINEADASGVPTYVVKYEDDDEIEYDVHPYYMRRNFKSSGGKKAQNCGSCSFCLAPDCGDCKYCLDMKKFGGKGTLRQRCEMRRCNNKLAPSDWCDTGPHKKRSTKKKSAGQYKAAFPQEDDWVKINYEDDGGWTYGIVVESKPEENLVDILFEDDDRREETVLDSNGNLDKDFKMATYQEFATNNKKFGKHDVPATKYIMMVKCFKCSKHRKIPKTEGKKIERGWVCGMAGLKDMETGKLFKCQEGESANLEEIFGKEVMEDIGNESTAASKNTSPRKKTFQGAAMKSAGVIDGIEMFESEDAENGVEGGEGEGFRSSSLSFAEMYGKDSIFSIAKHGDLSAQELKWMGQAIPTKAHEASKTKKRDLKRLENSRKMFFRAAVGKGVGVENGKKGLQHELFDGMDIEIFEEEEEQERRVGKRRMDKDDNEGQDGAMKRSKGLQDHEKVEMYRRIRFLESMLQAKERENTVLMKKLVKAEHKIAELEAGGQEGVAGESKEGSGERTNLPFSAIRTIKKAIASDTTKDAGDSFMKLVYSAIDSAPSLGDVLKDEINLFNPNDCESLKNLLSLVIGEDRTSDSNAESNPTSDAVGVSETEVVSEVAAINEVAAATATESVQASKDIMIEEKVVEKNATSIVATELPGPNVGSPVIISEDTNKEKGDAWTVLQKKLDRRSSAEAEEKGEERQMEEITVEVEQHIGQDEDEEEEEEEEDELEIM